MIEKEMNRLLESAKKDLELKKQLIATKSDTDPMDSFCKLCQKNGYKITIGEIIALGQNMNDAKLRSVNGGGCWEIEGWDDAFENFFAQLEWTD